MEAGRLEVSENLTAPRPLLGQYGLSASASFPMIGMPTNAIGRYNSPLVSPLRNKLRLDWKPFPFGFRNHVHHQDAQLGLNRMPIPGMRKDNVIDCWI
jgi:hypothetical protein